MTRRGISIKLNFHFPSSSCNLIYCRPLHWPVFTEPYTEFQLNLNFLISGSVSDVVYYTRVTVVCGSVYSPVFTGPERGRSWSIRAGSAAAAG